MLSYEDLVELAKMCARNAWRTTSREVAEELRQMAKEYQARAAELVTSLKSATGLRLARDLGPKTMRRRAFRSRASSLTE